MRITQDILAKKEKKTGGIMDSHSVITVVPYNLITAYQCVTVKQAIQTVVCLLEVTVTATCTKLYK